MFLLLFNIQLELCFGYFYSKDDVSDINDKQCFCEVNINTVVYSCCNFFAYFLKKLLPFFSYLKFFVNFATCHLLLNSKSTLNVAT